eukprot:TRINITY_DN3298_c0_g1_i10.p2 TRINITY_DN3298_c0_g1~~TRINITY_DN3298_c0_g1_i10.p2  ORF type:complete len:141 (+),score=22.53 TRINITY_DN3298_c0_g1_i10:108-530(+)
MKVNGVVAKYAEPPEAAPPEQRWRIYVFKEGTDGPKETLHIHRQSKYLIGRERRLADIPVDHLSCSKQHAVIQYRRKEITDEFFNVTYVVKPYIMDLQSTHGTFLNGNKIEPARYYEILHEDIVKFGQSTRDYVFLCTTN